jgi:hypothetical protein
MEGRCDSVDSLGSLGSEDSGARELDNIWKKRQSMKMAMGASAGDTDSTGTDEVSS